MANTDMNPDFIPLELDTFISPRAANDVPDDGFIPLDMDGAPNAIPTADPTVEAWSEQFEPIAEPMPEQENPFATLADDLAAISQAATENAAVQSAGSFADGTMLGVGFRTAEGYITALAHGVKATTAESYKQTLRQWMPQADIDALPVVIIPEATAPVGAGIVHMPTGPGYFDVPRAQRKATSTHTPENDDLVILAPVTAAIETSEKVCGIELAWNPSNRDGRHEIPRAFVCDLLDANELSLYHPPIPMPKGLFGVVFKGLNNAEAREARETDDRLLARCVTRGDFALEWPENLVSRYVVGTIDATMDLGSLGSKDLVCSLVKTDAGFECQFNGGTAAMRRAITERFTALQGASVLNVTTLLKWYTGVLENRLGAIRDGFAMLIVDNGTDLAKERIATAEKLATVLQGSDLYGPSPIMGRRLKVNRVVSRSGVTTSQFHVAVGAGMLNDVREHGKVFAKALLDSQTFARAQESSRSDATPDSIELAVRRAQIGSDRATNKAIGLLATLKALQTRATAMVSAIGEHARPAILACEALRAEYAPKCKGIDATSEMFANIELS